MTAAKAKKKSASRGHTGTTGSGNVCEVRTERIGKVSLHKRGRIYYLYYREGGLTKPIYWARPRLSINPDARDGATRAELVDLWGKPVDDYMVKDSDPFTGDALDHTMTWTRRNTVA